MRQALQSPPEATRSRISPQALTNGVYVHYGCGLCAPEGWLNFDASPTLRFQRIPIVGNAAPGPRFHKNTRYGDIITGLPVPSGTADVVYCSHVLEHLALEDFRRALRNTYRVLRSGGTFRLVVPDLKACAEHYLNADSPDAAITFITDMRIGLERRPRGVRGLLRTWLGNSGHRWMWDYEAMKAELNEVGFTDIRRARFGDNPDPMFAGVESPGRWNGALGMECRK